MSVVMVVGDLDDLDGRHGASIEPSVREQGPRAGRYENESERPPKGYRELAEPIPAEGMAATWRAFKIGKGRCTVKAGQASSKNLPTVGAEAPLARPIVGALLGHTAVPPGNVDFSGSLDIAITPRVMMS